MGETVSRISLSQPAPIQVDSTEPEVIEAALERIPGPGDRQLGQPRGRPRQARPGRPAGDPPRRGADRADDRPEGMAKTADRKLEVAREIHRPRLRRARARPGAADLRRAHVHADDRRRGVASVGGRDDRGRSGGSRRSCPGVKTSLGVSNVSFGISPAARAVLNSIVPAPLRRGRARPGDGQPEPHHAVRGDPRAGAGARRRPRLQSLRRRARAVHRALREQGAGGGGRRGRRSDRGHGARGGPALPDPPPQEGRASRSGSTARSRRSAPSRP